jgi:hypothetical protein
MAVECLTSAVEYEAALSHWMAKGGRAGRADRGFAILLSRVGLRRV